jgi:hypothetical protein
VFLASSRETNVSVRLNGPRAKQHGRPHRSIAGDPSGLTIQTAQPSVAISKLTAFGRPSAIQLCHHRMAWGLCQLHAIARPPWSGP